MLCNIYAFIKLFLYVAACCVDLNQHVNKLKGTKSKNVNGWTIDVSRGSFTNSTGCPKAEEDDSWYGFDVYNKGSIETTLHGCGRARLDFGSCSDGYSFGETNIYLNEKIISKATAGELSKEIEFDFNEGDILKLEEWSSTLKFNNFTILSCCEKV